MELENVILDNISMVYKLSHNFNYSLREDLVQVGVIGIIKAYKKYDPKYNVKFSTYAYDYILGEMKKLVREDKGIKISKDLNNLYFKIEKVNELLIQKYKRNPTTKELSEYLNVDESYIIDALNSKNNIDSLDSVIIGDSKDLNLYDFIKSKDVDIDSLIDLRNSINKLKKFEKDILINRYYNDLSQVETAHKLNISQVKVSRNEKKILQKIKENVL